MQIHFSKIFDWPKMQFHALFKRQERKVEGLFYKIKDKSMKTQGYLLGTMHAQLDPHVVLDKKIYRALEKASKLFLEYVYNTSPEGLKRCLEYGCIDLILKMKALEMHKEVDSLEQLKQQLDTIDAIKKEFGLKNFDYLFKALEKARLDPNMLTDDEKESIEFLKQMKACWINGEEDFFEMIRKIFPKIATADRDLPMAENIHLALEKKMKPFIAIGSCHLVGDDGVVSLLRNKGWMMVKVDHAKAPKSFLLKKIGNLFKALRSLF